MAKKIKLSSGVSGKLASLAADLQDEYDELQEVFDGRSEAWLESDAGMAADAWLESLGELIEALENFEDQPEEY